VEVEMRSLLRRLVVTLALLCSLPAPAHAQPSLDRWAGFDVKELQTIYVRDTAGIETAGRLLQLNSDSLVVLAGGVERRFEPGDVVRLQKRDSLRNGTLIGLAVGAAMGLLAAGISDCPGEDPGGSCAGVRATTVAVSMGVYTGLGAGIDALIRGRTTIYERRGAASSLRAVVPLARVTW